MKKVEAGSSDTCFQYQVNWVFKERFRNQKTSEKKVISPCGGGPRLWERKIQGPHPGAGPKWPAVQHPVASVAGVRTE